MFKAIVSMLLFLAAIPASVIPMENSNSKDITAELRTILDAAQKMQNNELTEWAYTVAVESNETTEQFQNSFKREELQAIGKLCADHLLQKYIVKGYDANAHEEFDKLLADFMNMHNTLRFRSATSLVKSQELPYCYKARLLCNLAYHEESVERRDAMLKVLLTVLKKVQVSSREEAIYVLAGDLTNASKPEETARLSVLYNFLNAMGNSLQHEFYIYIAQRVRTIRDAQLAEHGLWRDGNPIRPIPAKAAKFF